MDLLSAKIICQAAAGLLVLSSVFPVCIFGASGFPVEELKGVKLDILKLTLKGNTGHFSMAYHDRYWHPFTAESLLCALVHRVFLASLLHGKLSFCPRFPWKSWPPSHDLQHCCGPGLLAEMPSLPSAHAAHSVSLLAAVGVVCLAVFANLAFSCLLSRFVDGWRDHTEHTEGWGCVQWITMKCLVCAAAWALFEREPSWCLCSELLSKQGQA